MKRFRLSHCALSAVLLLAGEASAQNGGYPPYSPEMYGGMPAAHMSGYGGPAYGSPYDQQMGQPPMQMDMSMGYGGNASCADGSCGAGGAGAYPGFGNMARGGLDLGWFIGTEAIFLKRSTSEPQELILDAADNDVLINATDASFTFEPGLLIRGGVFTDAGPGLEIVYFGIDDWHGSEREVETNGLNLAGDIGLTTFDFFAADKVRVDYDSELDNFELNVVQPYGHLWIISGFRYMELSEVFNINSFDTDSGRSDFNIETDNFLWGAQVGFRAEYDFYAIGVDIIGKVGLFDNAGYQRQILRDLNNTIELRDADSVGAHVATVGEFGISGTVQLTEVFMLRAGYNILVLSGLALAPQQIDLSDDIGAGTSLNQDGEILAHGINIGIEGRW